MLLETLVPFLYLEKEKDKGKGKNIGHKKKEEVPGFPVNQKLEMSFLCAADKNWSCGKGKQKRWIRKLL